MVSLLEESCISNIRVPYKDNKSTSEKINEFIMGWQ